MLIGRKGDIMKRTVMSILLVIGMLPLLGCNPTEELNKEPGIYLYVDGEEYLHITEIEANESIELPIAVKEGYLFTGWSGDTDTYFDSIDIQESGLIELTAQFELIEDVFTYRSQMGDDDPLIAITGYTGEAGHLRIPQMINGSIVTVIDQHAFLDSEISSIEIPIDAYVLSNAFRNVLNLQSITFYGETKFDTSSTQIIVRGEYLEIIELYSCVINMDTYDGTDEDTSYAFVEGCPIIEVMNINTIEIGQAVYSNYEVLMHNEFVDTMWSSFTTLSIANAPMLETIEIPNYTTYLFADFCSGCPELKELIIDENHRYFSVLDGALYNKEQDYLMFYPRGLTGTSFEISNSEFDMSIIAFYENTTIRTLVLPSDYSGQLPLVGLDGLEEFIVTGEQSKYFVEDGILYSDNTLIRYPSNKISSSFVVPSTINTIGTDAFYGNVFLEDIDLESVTTIMGYAFRNSKSIQSIEISQNIEYMGIYLFVESAVQEITLQKEISETYTAMNIQQSFVFTQDQTYIIYVPDASFDEYEELLDYPGHVTVIRVSEKE